MRISLLGLVEEALKENIAHKGLDDFLNRQNVKQRESVIEVLDGWLSAGALALKHGTNHSKDRALANVVRSIIERACSEDEFVIESFVLANGSRQIDHDYSSFNRDAEAQLEEVATLLKGRDIIDKVETTPFPHSKKVFEMSVRAPQVIGTSYANIGHLFKVYQLDGRVDPSIRHLYVPTSLVFFSNRLNILMHARSKAKKCEVLLQMGLYWSVMTSDPDQQIARDYLYQPEVWAKAIKMFEEDKVLGADRFGSIRAWLTEKGRDLEDNKCRDAVNYWLGTEALNEEDIDIRTELLRKLREMITDLQRFYLEVDGIFQTSRGRRRTPPPHPSSDSYRPKYSAHQPVARKDLKRRGPRPGCQVRTMFGEDR